MFLLNHNEVDAATFCTIVIADVAMDCTMHTAESRGGELRVLRVREHPLNV